MATEQAKNENRARLWGLTAMGLTLGIWDMVQESAAALSPAIGQAILADMEKVVGLEIVAGEDPEAILVELCRSAVDDSGSATSTKVEKTSNGFRVTLINAVGTAEFAALMERGVERLFSHPAYCVGVAALAKAGHKARGNVEIDKANNNQIISFELL